MQESNDRPGGTVPPGDSGISGFRFNQVGREEAATQVFRPQVDAATKMRRVLIIGLVLVVFAGLMYVNWVRTGKWNPFEEPENSTPFAPPEPQLPS